MSTPQHPQGQPYGQPQQQPQYGQPQQAPQPQQMPPYGHPQQSAPQPHPAPQQPQYGQPQQAPQQVPPYGQAPQYGQAPYGQGAYAPPASASSSNLWVILSFAASGLAVVLFLLFNLLYAGAVATYFQSLNSFELGFDDGALGTANAMLLLRNIFVPLMAAAGAVFGYLASLNGNKFLGGIGLGLGGGITVIALINLIGVSFV